MPEPLLRVEHLTKEYRRGVRANDDISFEVAAGQVVGLLGHNGAGKTTLLNQVVGLVRPSSGKITLDGQDAIAHPATARTLCSLQPQGRAPLDGVTPRQAITMMARIRGAGRHQARERADELLDALDIGHWADRPGSALSGGVRRLTAFGMTAAEPGRLVMLDEPTNDVGPVRRRLLWEQVRALADRGCAVVLVTHNVIEAERAVDTLVVLDKGRVVTQGTPAELRGDQAGRLRLELVAPDEPTGVDLARRFAGEMFCAATPVRVGRRVSAPVTGAEAAATWSQRHQDTGTIEEFTLSPPSLEDVYIRLVGGDDPSNTTTTEQEGGAGHAELVA